MQYLTVQSNLSTLAIELVAKLVEHQSLGVFFKMFQHFQNSTLGECVNKNKNGSTNIFIYPMLFCVFLGLVSEKPALDVSSTSLYRA